MTREEKLAAAGEYAIGALDGAELAAFEARMAGDTELAAMVRRLQEQLQALDDTAVATPLSDSLWAAIEPRLGEQQAAPVRVVTPRAAPPWPVARFAAAAAIVAALGLGFMAGALLRPTPQPVVIAVLLDEGSTSPGAIVEAFSDNSVRVVPLEAFEVPQGSILQVWTLPDPATGPVSLGTFADPHDIRLVGPNLPPPQPGQLYEITLEPAPGSPTGRPTGPILVKGFAKSPI